MTLTLDTTTTIDASGLSRTSLTAQPHGGIDLLARAAPLLWFLLLAPWMFAGACVVAQGTRAAMRPVATCETEMHILDGVARIARSEPLYPPIDGLPLAYHLYNPLTYLPAGLAGRWWGLDLDEML